MKTKATIEALPDQALLQSLKDLSVREIEATVELLMHLVEVEKRKLFVPAGFSSMFAYCTQSSLRYSEPAANRRISCARAIGRFPDLAAELISKQLSLTTLSLVGGILTSENKAQVVAEIRGKSRREVEEFICGYRPRQKEPREQVKPLVVAMPRHEPSPLGSLFESKNQPDSAVNSSTISTFARECDASPVVAPQGHETRQPRTGAVPCTAEGAVTEAPREQRFELKFTIGADARKKLDQAKLLLSGKYPRGVRIEDVFEEALELLLEKCSPQRRLARRSRREEKAAAQHQGAPLKPSRTDSAEAARPNRHIPCALRDQVHARDGGQCTFVGIDGVRCRERAHLELHHVVPYGRAGSHALSNLKVRCRTHNMYQAVQDYGYEHMARYQNARIVILRR